MRRTVLATWIGLGGLTGCFDLDASRPECFADDPCANGAACVAGRCGAVPTRSVTLDVSACTADPTCVAQWDDGTLCAVVQLDDVVAIEVMGDPGATVDMQLPDTAGAVNATVFVRTGGGCSSELVPGADCAEGCTLAWDFAATDVVDGAIALTADCADVRWADQPVEACDGGDQDCDGQVDEDAVAELDDCAAGIGACEQAGTVDCFNGAPRCLAEPGTPTDEVLDDGVDNDCDGTIDETPPPCPPGEVRPCSTMCGDGESTCTPDGMPGPCLDAVGVALPDPVDEICNAVDDDCDGMTDEGFDVGQVCPLGGPGCPAMGMLVCEQDAAVCAGEVPPDLVETCDGGDNDCDGAIDEDFDIGSACLVGVGSCRRDGTRVCDDLGGATCAGQPGVPGEEICNGLDDDCDERTDELLGVGDACARGENACATMGTRVCLEDGSVVCDAPDPPEPVDEACNAADDDCDGQIDEGFDVGAACMRGEGMCAETGVFICADDVAICDAPEPQVFMEEICNSGDDDCDGIVDEDFDFESDPAHCGGCGVDCARANAQVECAQRECAITMCDAGFVDLNADSADGCECEVTGVDVPDINGIDADCDGVDGDADLGIFVDPILGDDANAGTPDAPLATLAAALALVTPARPHVHLSVEDHVVVEPLALPDGVQLHGGYGGVVDGWRRVPKAEGATVIDGPRFVFQFTDLTGPTLVDRLDIVTPSGNSNYIGIVAINVGQHLTLREVEIRTGRGFDGPDGAAGSAALIGLAVPGPGMGSTGGVFGENGACPTRGGSGGNANSQPGTDASDGAAGGAGAEDAGLDGEPGTPGAPGTHGAVGEGAVATGRIGVGRWRPLDGREGGAGTTGRSGGGGGGGGGEVGPIGPFQLGGGGGGGAAGGCPGGGGGRGISGGASIGIIVSGGQIRIVAGRIQTDAGGNGGRGGDGAPGAEGGNGAAGEPACEGCGAGGPGGDGGDGGCGGPGGGGAGGPSIGVLGVGAGIPAVFEDLAGAAIAPDIAIGAGGVSGAGGTGCDGAVGGAGAVGIALPIACCILGEDGSTCAALAACEVP